MFLTKRLLYSSETISCLVRGTNTIFGGWARCVQWSSQSFLFPRPSEVQAKSSNLFFLLSEAELEKLREFRKPKRISKVIFRLKKCWLRAFLPLRPSRAHHRGSLLGTVHWESYGIQHMSCSFALWGRRWWWLFLRSSTCCSPCKSFQSRHRWGCSNGFPLFCLSTLKDSE